jgi:hypothetical protein
VPKNEREWWASREIEKLERELTETERLRFGADADRRRLRCDLSAAKAEASHYMAVAQKATDELIFFRADSLKAHQMTCAAGLERDSIRAELARLRALFPEILAALRNGAGCTADVSVGFLESVPNEVASVVSRLRAEVERLTAKIGNQADRIRYLEGAINHATGTPLSKAIARAEKAEAERDAASQAYDCTMAIHGTVMEERDRLATELTAARSERDLAITRVACILWSGAIDKHTCGDVQKWADYYTAELARLRAEVERWQTVAATMSQEREHNANEASRLRAELQAELAAMKDTPTL